MLNDKGEIADMHGIMCLSFAKVCFTPPLDAGSLRGITRAAAMEIAEQMGIPVKEQALTRYDLWIADECFLTGTAAEVIPVWKWITGPLGMETGELTRKLIERFRESVKTDGVSLGGRIEQKKFKVFYICPLAISSAL